MESETVSERTIDPESRVAISSEIEESSENSPGRPTPASPSPPTCPTATSRRRPAEQLAQRHREPRAAELRGLRDPPRAGDRCPARSAGSASRSWSTASSQPTRTAPRPGRRARPRRSRCCASWCSRRSASTPTRGDVVTIQSLQFTLPPEQGALVECRLGFLAANGARLIQLGVLAAVVLALIFFVLRPLRRPPPGARDHRADRPARAGPARSASSAGASPRRRHPRPAGRRPSPRSSGCATSSPAAARTRPRCCAAGSSLPNPARSPPDHERLPPGEVLPGAVRTRALGRAGRAPHRRRARGGLPPRLPRRPGGRQRGASSTTRAG